MAKKKVLRKPDRMRSLKTWGYSGPSKHQRDNMINTGIYSVKIINPEIIYKFNPKHKRGRK